MRDRKRVVITGMGAMTPLALNLEETWEGLLAGRSGVGLITQIDASPFPSRIAGELRALSRPTTSTARKPAAWHAARRWLSRWPKRRWRKGREDWPDLTYGRANGS